MFLDYFGTLVTLIAIVSTPYMGEAVEMGEPLYTDQPLSTERRMANAGDIVSTDKPVLTPDITIPSDAPLQTTEGKSMLPGDHQFTTNRPKTDKLPTQEWNSFLPGETSDVFPTPKGNSVFPGENHFIGDPQLSPEGSTFLSDVTPSTDSPQLTEGWRLDLTRETPSSNGPEWLLPGRSPSTNGPHIAESWGTILPSETPVKDDPKTGWELIFPDDTPSTDGPNIAEVWETVLPGETPSTQGPHIAEGLGTDLPAEPPSTNEEAEGAETVLPRETLSTTEYFTTGQTEAFRQNLTLLPIEVRDTTTHGKTFVNMETHSTSDSFLTSGNRGSNNSIITPVYGEITTSLKGKTLQTTWQSASEDANNDWSTVPTATSSEGDVTEDLGGIGEISDCREALCTYIYGVNSECIVSPGTDSFDENIVTTTPSTIDIIDADFLCRCKPGYSFQGGNCTEMQYVDLMKCCTDEECELKMGVNSECGLREGGNPEICNAVEVLRPRRDVGAVVSPSVPSNWIRLGECICKTGNGLVNGQCKGSDTNNTDGFVQAGATTSVTSSTALLTDSTRSTVQTTNPSSKKCYEWRCTGEGCDQHQGLVDNYCSPLGAYAVCYVSKLCGFGGDNYIFGCKDPCNSQTGSESRDCFTVTCFARDIACNNETLILNEFQCSGEEGVSFSLDVLVVLVMVVFSFV